MSPTLVYCVWIDKALIWLGPSRRDIQDCPSPARRIAGFQLVRVQQGLEPSDWKPMTALGSGVREIRIHTGTERRVSYVARFGEGQAHERDTSLAGS